MKKRPYQSEKKPYVHHLLYGGCLLFSAFLAGNTPAWSQEKDVSKGREIEQQTDDVASRTVKGIVMDNDGMPVIGATIAATRNGKEVANKITDTNGVFEILAPAGSMLKVSSIGYETKTLRANFNHVMKIVLENLSSG